MLIMSHHGCSESGRLSLLREYYSSGMSKHAFVKRHHLSGLAILNRWLKKYSLSEKEPSLSSEDIQPSETESSISNRSKESHCEGMRSFGSA